MKKRIDLPTTNELQNLINNLKLTKPQSSKQTISCHEIDNYSTIVRACQETSEPQSQFQSVIEDDYSNYKCFQALQKEYLEECEKMRSKESFFEHKVILRSPIYRLTQEEPHTSPFNKGLTEKPQKTHKSYLQSTLSTSSKQLPCQSKEGRVRRQLFKDKENSNTCNMSVKAQPDKEVKTRQLHKFSNCQQFLRRK